MQHFSKQLRTRLLTLYLSAGLVMGWLPGCGSQDLEIADTVAESAVTATADATDVITFSQPEGPEESTVYVEPVDGISDDFYRGMDVSAVLALENSGVKYYNFDGEEQDVFMTLAQAGVNYIRLRVWNDPYDENGNGYGGGNNDVATAITLGQRATQYGMKVCIDFHYSDFWADPKKQFVPKAWEGMDIEEKSDALYNFTLENLTQILDAGVDVGMVQVGNEINNGMCGETDASNVRKLLASGSKAVRDAATASGKDILVAVHYTNIDDMKKLDTLLTGLQVKEIDYDIVGLSFYPYWHGTMEDLKNAIIHVRDTYGQKVYVAETLTVILRKTAMALPTVSREPMIWQKDIQQAYRGRPTKCGMSVRLPARPVPKASSTGKVPGSRSVPPMLIILPSGKNTAAVGPAVMQAVMIQRMPDSITAEAPGTIRPCLTSPDILWPP